MKTDKKRENRLRRHKRIRARAYGTSHCPRLCVFRSPKHIYAQLIDDEKGVVLAAASDRELKRGKTDEKSAKAKEGDIKLVGKIKSAYEVGKLIAQKAEKNKISKIVFDRGGYQYHGRIKALADSAREAGLKF